MDVYSLGHAKQLDSGEPAAIVGQPDALAIVATRPALEISIGGGIRPHWPANGSCLETCTRLVSRDF